MMILRGKYKGKKFTLSQACNDWFTVKEVPQVFTISNAQFTRDEAFYFLDNLDNVGMMFREFGLNWDKLRFYKRKI